MHHYFRYPEGVDRLGNSVSKIGMGVDVRARRRRRRRPSQHAPERGLIRLEVTPAEMELQPGGGAAARRRTGSRHRFRGPARARAGGPRRSRPGSRDDTSFRIGRGLRLRGLSDEAIAAALRADNEARCDRPSNTTNSSASIRQVRDPLDAEPDDGVGPSSASSASSKPVLRTSRGRCVAGGVDRRGGEVRAGGRAAHRGRRACAAGAVPRRCREPVGTLGARERRRRTALREHQRRARREHEPGPQRHRMGERQAGARRGGPRLGGRVHHVGPLKRRGRDLRGA